MTDKNHQSHDIKPYLFVFGALLVLTVVTVTVSYLHLAPGPAIALGLAIATFKAALVAAVFMHLKTEKAVIYGLLGVTTLFLIILFTIPISDSALTSSRRPDKVDLAEHAGSAEHPAH